MSKFFMIKAIHRQDSWHAHAKYLIGLCGYWEVPNPNNDNLESIMAQWSARNDGWYQGSFVVVPALPRDFLEHNSKNPNRTFFFKVRATPITRRFIMQLPALSDKNWTNVPPAQMKAAWKRAEAEAERYVTMYPKTRKTLPEILTRFYLRALKKGGAK